MCEINKKLRWSGRGLQTLLWLWGCGIPWNHASIHSPLSALPGTYSTLPALSIFPSLGTSSWFFKISEVTSFLEPSPIPSCWVDSLWKPKHFSWTTLMAFIAAHLSTGCPDMLQVPLGSSMCDVYFEVFAVSFGKNASIFMYGYFLLCLGAFANSL